MKTFRVEVKSKTQKIMKSLNICLQSSAGNLEKSIAVLIMADVVSFLVAKNRITLMLIILLWKKLLKV